MKWLMISVVFLLLVGVVITGSILFNASIDEEKKDFQGPVPLGYDLDHFRETGETKKEMINDG